MTLGLIFLICCALVCFLLATFGAAARINLTALGLALLTVWMLAGQVVIRG